MNKTVRACICQDWHLHVWSEEEPAIDRHIPWSCRSWRHEGECRLWKGAQDFVRISEAMTTRKNWTYIVLTFAQGDWPDKWQQYKQGVVLWSKLRKRIVRKWGKFEYIQTWERHNKGGAHVNVVVSNYDLHQAVIEDWREVRRDWLEPHAVECGFGMRTWIEPIRGQVEMAGYMTKLSKELTGQIGKSQIPEDAPPHFRRIRASVRTLPPVRKSDLTGRMVFCTLDRWLDLTKKGANPQKAELPQERTDPDGTQGHIARPACSFAG